MSASMSARASAFTPTMTTTKSVRRARARGAVVVRAGRFETERTYIMIKCVRDECARREPTPFVFSSRISSLDDARRRRGGRACARAGRPRAEGCATLATLDD